MQELLKHKLRDHMAHNRPGLLLRLQQTGTTMIYLEDKVSQLDNLPERLLDEGKPPYILTELCMAALTADRPIHVEMVTVPPLVVRDPIGLARHYSLADEPFIRKEKPEKILSEQLTGLQQNSRARKNGKEIS